MTMRGWLVLGTAFSVKMKIRLPGKVAKTTILLAKQ
jgi:hypothetical protein